MRPAPPRPPHQHTPPPRAARVPKDFHVHAVDARGVRLPVRVFSARLSMPCTAAMKHAKALRAEGHSAWISCVPAAPAPSPAPAPA